MASPPKPEGRRRAERVGFEPTRPFPVYPLSRRALSTAQTPLRVGKPGKSVAEAGQTGNTAGANAASRFLPKNDPSAIARNLPDPVRPGGKIATGSSDGFNPKK